MDFGIHSAVHGATDKVVEGRLRHGPDLVPDEDAFVVDGEDTVVDGVDNIINGSR